MKKYKFFIGILIGISTLISCQKSNDVIVEEIEEVVEETIIDADNVLSETVLEANGEGDTYELINSVLAPGYDVIEAPDCSHELFGRHIDEIFDNDLNKNVFRFHIHTTPDNDRCINFDRQRNEIKAYDKSPDELKGVKNEKVVYSWKFKLQSDFKPSSNFTHIHQIKAVGGTEDAMPLITLTARKGSPDKLELRYSETTSQVTLTEIELASFKGSWVEVVETVIYGEKEFGTYKIEIKDFSTKNVLLSYSNDEIRMWKTDADFMRPKWGIYRSLLDATSLKDETLLFADFNIKEFKK